MYWNWRRFLQLWRARMSQNVLDAVYIRERSWLGVLRNKDRGVFRQEYETAAKFILRKHNHFSSSLLKQSSHTRFGGRKLTQNSPWLWKQPHCTSAECLWTEPSLLKLGASNYRERRCIFGIFLQGRMAFSELPLRTRPGKVDAGEG